VREAGKDSHGDKGVLTAVIFVEDCLGRENKYARNAKTDTDKFVG
jgi:hypothetical protein